MSIKFLIQVIFCFYFSTITVWSQSTSQCMPGRGICIPKCCPENEILSDADIKRSGVIECRNQSSSDPESPLLFDIKLYNNNLNGRVQYHYGSPICSPEKLRVFSSKSSDVPVFTKDEALIIESKNQTFPKGTFCMDHTDPYSNTTFYIACDEGPTIFYKCCNDGQKFNFSNHECVSDTAPLQETHWSWLPDLQPFKVNPGIIADNTSQLPRDAVVEYGIPICSGNFTIISREIIDSKIDASDKTWQLYPSGYLTVTQHEEYSNYCVDQVISPIENIEFYVAQFCIRDHYLPCKNYTCYQKCCKAGQVMSEDLTCTEINENAEKPLLWKPQFHERYILGNTGPVSNVNLSKYHQIEQFPKCDNGEFVVGDTDESDNKFNLLENGDLYIHSYRDVTKVGSYCIDSYRMEPFLVREIALVCFPPDVPIKNDELKFILYPIGLFISILFLAATFFVYAIIPELQNFHGKTLLSHVASLFTAYLCLFIIQVAPEERTTGTKYWCKTMGLIIQYAFLASFFWLSAMCFDIFWTFSGMRPIRGGIKERDHKKFIRYSLYSWVCPMIFSIITMVMEFTKSIPAYFIKPNFGLKNCWFGDDLAILAYFYGPVAFLLLCNLFFFVLTAVKLMQLHTETSVLHSDNKKAKEKDKERIILYLKLFILMGITWILEVISWAVGGPNGAWYFTDLANTLRGVFIFIIFVCKRNIFALLRAKFRRIAKHCRIGKTNRHRLHDATVDGPQCTGISSSTSDYGATNTCNISLSSKKTSLASRKTSDVSSPRHSDSINMKTLNENTDM